MNPTICTDYAANKTLLKRIQSNSALSQVFADPELDAAGFLLEQPLGPHSCSYFNTDEDDPTVGGFISVGVWDEGKGPVEAVFFYSRKEDWSLTAQANTDGSELLVGYARDNGKDFHIYRDQLDSKWPGFKAAVTKARLLVAMEETNG